MNDSQPKYTQVIDEKSGEIKYVPETPPKSTDEDESNEGKDGSRKDGDTEGNPNIKERSTDKGYETAFNETVGGKDLTSDEKLNKVLNALIENAKKLRYDRRLTHGKLDGRRLLAYKTSDRLFKKRAIKYRSYRFAILVDTSGSMFHSNNGYDKSKMALAIQSTVKMVRTLEDLKIPVTVIAMNYETRMIKSFDETYDENQFIDRFRNNVASRIKTEDGVDYAENLIGGTAEYVAYTETMRYLRSTRNSKAEDIVFVLSDGEPTDKIRGGANVVMEDGIARTVDYEESDDSVDNLYKFWKGAKDVRTYGIGIMSDARQIPNAKRLNDVEMLPTVTNKLIQDILL